MPLVPSFRIKLEDQILQGLATVGKFDGKNPCLTCATSGGKIFVYDPYSRRDEQDTPKVRYLNINKNITAVASGRLDPNIGRDILLVGTNTDVMAYDVEENLAKEDKFDAYIDAFEQCEPSVDLLVQACQ